MAERSSELPVPAHDLVSRRIETTGPDGKKMVLADLVVSSPYDPTEPPAIITGNPERTAAIVRTSREACSDQSANDPRTPGEKVYELTMEQGVFRR